MESFWLAVDEGCARGDLLPLGILCDALAEAGDPTEAPLRWCYEQRRMPGVWPDGQAWWCPTSGGRSLRQIRGQGYTTMRRQSSWIPSVYWPELACEHRRYWFSIDHPAIACYCSVHEAYQDFAVAWLQLVKDLLDPATGRNLVASTNSRWRNESRRVITVTLKDLPKDATEGQLRKAIKDAYPFGERRGHPYKIWLSEQRMFLAKMNPFPSQSPGVIEQPNLFAEAVS